MTTNHEMGAGNWEFLREELAVVRAELGRIDGKCSTLAGLASAGLAFLLTQIAAAAPVVAVLYGAAGAALAAAALLLLAGVLRPRLGDTGFCQYAALSADDIRALATSSTDEYVVTVPADLAFLSAVTVRKQRRLRAAIDLIAAAVVLIAAGLASGALT